MKPHSWKTETKIKRPIKEVFEFFSNAENLDLLTPPELRFKILTPGPVTMKKNAIIDYKLYLFHIPFYWRTRITVWEPPFRFIDEQVKGPYHIWIHEHSFLENGTSTIMIDNIQFLSKGYFLEPILNKLFVEKKVKDIFSYREKKLLEIFNE